VGGRTRGCGGVVSSCVTGSAGGVGSGAGGAGVVSGGAVVVVVRGGCGAGVGPCAGPQAAPIKNSAIPITVLSVRWDLIAGGGAEDVGAAIAVDAGGRAYLTGSFMMMGAGAAAVGMFVVAL